MKMDNRHCTDVICCLLFVVFVVLMIGVSGYSFAEGDVVRIFTPFDSDGNQCGQPNQDKSNETLEQVIDNNRDFTDYPYKYFSGLIDIASSGTIPDSAYNAVCVKECPKDLTYANEKAVDC